MAGPENMCVGRYGFRGKCSIEQLETLLNSAMRDTSVDEAYLDALGSAILRCETEHPSGRLANVEKAWERFQRVYLTEDTERFELSKWIEIPELSDTMRYGHPRQGIRRIGRMALVAAVVVVLITLLLPPALGYQNIFQMVALWTDEQFKFAPPAYGSPEVVAESGDEIAVTPLMESMEEHNLPVSFAPIWFPEDRQFVEANFVEFESGKSIFTAFFADENDEQAFYFKLIKTPPDIASQLSSTVWEKDDGEVIEFFYNNITHYIITNKGTVSIHWNAGQFEAAICGHISVEEAKAIVKSIYER